MDRKTIDIDANWVDKYNKEKITKVLEKAVKKVNKKAVSNNYWTETLYNYNNTTLRSNNWMYIGAFEWTISRSSGDTSYAFDVQPSGRVHMYDDGWVGDSNVVRPVFYLNSDVLYDSGDGSEDNPYRIKID